MNYQEKYFKYKNKYLQLKNIQLGQGQRSKGSLNLFEGQRSKGSLNLFEGHSSFNFFKGGASTDFTGTSAGGGGGHSSEGTINSFRGSTTSTVYTDKLSEKTIRDVILSKGENMNTDFFNRKNGYLYDFGGKILFYHPIIQYLNCYVGILKPININNLSAYKQINILIKNNIIDQFILIKQALYQLILNILFKNEIRHDLYDGLITFLIEEEKDPDIQKKLFDTIINELNTIILHGFNPDEGMPDLKHIYNKNITRETIISQAIEILNKQPKKSFKLYLLLMEHLGLLHILDASYESLTSIMAAYLNAHKPKTDSDHTTNASSTGLK